MHELKKLIKKELECFGKKNELCKTDVEPIYFLSKAYCELAKVERMEKAEEKRKFLEMLGYSDMNDDFSMEASGDFSFMYNMPDEYEMPMYYHAMKGYNPYGRRNMGRRNYPDRYSQQNRDTFDMDRSGEGRRNQSSDYSNQYDSNRYDSGRYSESPYRMNREKGYDPSMKEGYKESHGKKELSDEELKSWVKEMHNEDGSTGEKYNVEQTTALAKQHGVVLGDEVSEHEWWAAVNAMYSDYCKTAKKYGIDKPDYYADLAKDFLFDEDAVEAKEKLYAYYHNIVD